MPDEIDNTRDDIPLDEPFEKSGEEFGEMISREGAEVYPHFQIVAGPEEGRTIALKTGAQVIGRSQKQATLILDDTSLSRAHARVLVDEGGVVVQDLGSRNGTFLNGKKIGPDATPLNNLDQLKIGIYVLRLVTRRVTPEDLDRLREERMTQNPNVASFVAKPHEEEEEKFKLGGKDEGEVALTREDGEKDGEREGEKGGQAKKAEMKEDKDVGEAAGSKEEGLINDESRELIEKGQALMIPEEEEGGEDPLSSRLKILFLILCLVSGLAGLSYYLYSRQKPTEAKAVGDSGGEEMIEEVKEGQVSEEPIEEDKRQAVPAEEAKKILPPIEHSPRVFRAFLDIKTTPMQARIYFKDEPIGESPLKENVELEPGKSYEVIAEYDLREINDKYQKRLQFTADARKEVVSLNVDAEIGTVKILRLPRDVNFYLEGYYAYDKYRANPVKLTDIVYGRPIYVPFGRYIIELRERVRMGASDTYVNEIRYHREFEINGERRELELSILDRDLQFFPSMIKSQPSGSEVYLDGEKVGITPFEGDLPLGHHELKLTHEGFFDHVTDLEMRMNTPYEATIVLKTSRVGEFLNQAREYVRNEHYSDAIDTLVEALKLEGSSLEKAQVHLLLGTSYHRMGNQEQAATYFEQAKAHQDTYYAAVLGLARVRHTMGNPTGGLNLLVEVLLNVTGDTKDGELLKKEAWGFFKQVSPIKSVIYVHSEPDGATVLVNDQEIDQRTPVILSDLGLGNYRIEIRKAGYQTQQIKKNLKLSEFVPVFIDLKPEKI